MRFVLVLSQPQYGIREGSLDNTVYQHVARELRQKITSPPEQTELDVWLGSGGGNADAAFRLALEVELADEACLVVFAPKHALDVRNVLDVAGEALLG